MFLTAFSLKTYSAVYPYLPDTLWVKVTFYDFHADGSNPNFENGNCGFSRGLVQNTLDQDRKPVLLANNCFNDRVNEWFRPSNATANSKFIPLSGRWTNLVNYQNKPNEWVSSSFSPSNSMADVIIYDSLPFKIQDRATGTYIFDRDGFFWLDGRGFGNEPAGNSHNYGFSMELHQEFMYQGGESFAFEGDDDVWVFINGNLALDLGGMQKGVKRSISLDAEASKLGIVKGGTYYIDFFYSERNPPQSVCRITTNILTPSKPSEIVVRNNPKVFDPKTIYSNLSDTSVHAGDNLKLYSFIVDDTLGLRTDWDSAIVWNVIDTSGNKIPNLTFRGDSASFNLTEAYGTVKVALSFQNPEFPSIILHDTVYIHALPGSADHLVIESMPDGGTSLRQDNPLNSITISSQDSIAYAYAVIRDKYGNFISSSKSTLWNSLNTSIANAAAGKQSNGQGIVTKKAHGQTFVTATSNQSGLNLTKGIDSVLVSIDQYAGEAKYDSLKIGVRTASGVVFINELRIAIAEDTILVVQGHKTNGSVWEDVPSNWTVPSGLHTAEFPPVSKSTWNFVPTTAGQFTISVSNGSNLSTTIPVYVRPGAPAALEIYPKTGDPFSANNLSYPEIPVSLTKAAGDTVTLVAKLFDAYNFWIADYETTSTFAQKVQWEVRSVSTGLLDKSAGSLKSQSGNPEYFYPTKAYTTVDVIASVNTGLRVLHDTVRIAISAGKADHIVIEPDTNWQISPNKDNPIDTLRLSPVHQSDTVYAVIRDVFGNFVDFSKKTSWIAPDTSVASALSGNSVKGEGVVSRGNSTGTTKIKALSQDSSGMSRASDELVVINQLYWYDSLKIVTSSPNSPDTISMLTDQDTLLHVLGHRTDGNGWERVSCDWKFIDLKLFNIIGNAPANSPQWQISPTGIGSGKIRVTLGPESQTVPDTLFFDIRTAPPSDISFYIVSSTKNIRAGDTINAVVELRNSDGLLPGVYCYPDNASNPYAFYSDILPWGGRIAPVVITHSDTAKVGTETGSKYQIAECFKNGIDTVKFVLYYAPLSIDSLHKLSVTLGNLKASTDPFRLNAGVVDSIVMTDGKVPNGDQAQLSSPDSLYISITGYDKYGNKIGPVTADWHSSGNISIPPSDTSNDLYFQTKGIKTDQHGYIIACRNGTCDSLEVVLVGTGQRSYTAITRDTDGDGYIDEIEVTFTRAISLNNYSASNISVTYQNKTMPVNSITADNSLNTQYSISLKENKTGELQTGWTPFVRFSGNSDITDTLMTAADGAGPVIYRALYSTSGLTGANSRDTLFVTFSEKVICNQLRDNAPSVAFRYYTKTGPSQSTLNLMEYSGNSCQSTLIDRITLVFPATTVINPWEDSLQLAQSTNDASGNLPPPVNIARKASIEQIVKSRLSLSVSMNPFTPEESDVYSSIPGAYRSIIKNERYGTLIAINSDVPLVQQRDGSYAKVVIYDATGNIVINNIPVLKADNYRTYGFVWTGLNRNGRYVGTGAYLVVVTATDNAGNNIVGTTKVGLRRKLNSGN